VESFGRNTMNCEQAEAIVLDLDRDAAAGSLERAAAVAHLSHCPRCASLQESWEVAKEELRALAEETLEARAPSRVEMRLRQEFRTRYRTMVARRAAVVATWTLAAAAILVAAISSWNWQRTRREAALRHEAPAQSVATPSVPAQNPSGPRETVSASAKENEVPAVQTKRPKSASPAAMDDDAEKFTLLPGSVPAETDEAAIVRVRMQRGALGALGLPVNVERADEWIQVDLLVGNDGWPQAVRLAR
jgi:hypothetical protein